MRDLKYVLVLLTYIAALIITVFISFLSLGNSTNDDIVTTGTNASSTITIPMITKTTITEPTIPEHTVPTVFETIPSTTPASSPCDEFIPFQTYEYKGCTHDMPLSEELQYYTYCMAKEYGVPYRIIMGLMGVESGWIPDIGIVYHNGIAYIGLGMLSVDVNMEKFAEMGIDIATPEGNIEGICWHIRYAMDYFDGNIHYALMGYSSGVGATQQMINSGIYENYYSIRVIEFAESLKT